MRVGPDLRFHEGGTGSPCLITDQSQVAAKHVGTRDLDLGLSLALLDDARYREVSSRLRDRVE